jgi:hypothetical protein
VRRLARWRVLDRSHLFLLGSLLLRVPAVGADRGGLDSLAKEGEDDKGESGEWGSVLLHPAGAERGQARVQVHRGWIMALRCDRPHRQELVWGFEQYHLGSTITTS